MSAAAVGSVTVRTGPPPEAAGDRRLDQQSCQEQPGRGKRPEAAKRPQDQGSGAVPQPAFSGRRTPSMVADRDRPRIGLEYETGARLEAEHHLVLVAPAPVLALLRGADDRMPDLRCVLAGVLVLRGIAATHVPAGQADAQVDPAVARAEAVLAAFHGLRRLDGDLVEMGADGHGVEDKPRRCRSSCRTSPRLRYLPA